jgi:deoxycytidylate deaminase
MEHLLVRIDQCMALASVSRCVRSQYAAMLIDPAENIALMDGFNGPLDPPNKEDRRGFSSLCKGSWCIRNGVTEADIKVVHTDTSIGRMIAERRNEGPGYYLVHKSIEKDIAFIDDCVLSGPLTNSEIDDEIVDIVENLPFIEFGQHEVGCLCAERQLIFGCARRGVPTRGLWMIVTGSPCMACAKAICAAGISRVIVISDRYDDLSGQRFLAEHLEDGLHTVTEQDVRDMGLALRQAKKRPKDP